MTYWKFVSWDAVPIEQVKSALWPSAMAEYDKGNKKQLIELYRTRANYELIENGVYRLGGWEFSMREYCRKYWVKVQYAGIHEVYAPDRTTIRNWFGKHRVLSIVEV